MNHEDETEAPVPGLAGLDLRRAPARDLWPGIESRIVAAEVRRRRTPRLAGALAASLLAALAALLLLREDAVEPAGTLVATTPVGGATAPDGSATAPDGAPAVAPLEFAQRTLPQGDRAVVRAHLKILRQTAGELELAQRNHPEAEYIQRLQAANREQQQQLKALLRQGA